MNPTAIRALGLVLSIGYAGFIAWLYAERPGTLAAMQGGMASAVGLYEVDRAQFEAGRRLFESERYPEARAAFARADPAQRDPRTQFYIAYAFYRQGWGRLYNDDVLFGRALETLGRAAALSPTGRVQVEDSDLGLPDSDGLRAELERGLRIEPGDFNPLRVVRRRQ
jgi:hypothetical protein